MAKAFSIEDGNIQVAPITTSRQKTYADVDLTFEKNTAGDVFLKKDAAAVKQSIKNLLLTNSTEKPFQPSYGSDISGILFDLNTTVDISALKQNISNTISVYEPRAILRDINVVNRPDNNSIGITVIFQVINSSNVETVNVNIVRLR